MTALLEIDTPSSEQLAHQYTLEVVQRRLKECPYAFIFRSVTVDFEDGQLTLRGAVPSFHMKQMLQEVLRSIKQLARIRNEVEVVYTLFPEH